MSLRPSITRSISKFINNNMLIERNYDRYDYRLIGVEGNDLVSPCTLHVGLSDDLIMLKRQHMIHDTSRVS